MVRVAVVKFLYAPPVLILLATVFPFLFLVLVLGAYFIFEYVFKPLLILLVITLLLMGVWYILRYLFRKWRFEERASKSRQLRELMDKLNISPADHDRFVSNVYFTSFYTQLDKIGNILKLSLNEYTYSNDRKIWYLNESVIKIGLFSILPELRELHIRDDKGAIAKTGSELFLGLDKLETLLIERVDKNTLPKGLFLHLPNLKYIYLHQIDYFYKKYMKIFKWGSFFPIDSPTESDVEYLRTTFPIELLDLPQLKFIYTFSGLIRRGDFDKIRKINKASRKEIYEMFKEPEPDMPVVSKSEGGSNPLS